MNRLLLGLCVSLIIAFLVQSIYLNKIQTALIEAQSSRINTPDYQPETFNIEGLREFSSVEELEAWLAKDRTDKVQYNSEGFNCIDFAVMLRDNAFNDGYILSCEVLPVGAHWVNTAIIDGTLYIIEPQNDQILFTDELN
jgi:hypothetical protein